MKTMKRLLILAGFAFLIASCGNSQTNEVKADNATATEYGAAKVEVYYFHATRRCPTCNKIEDVSKDFVNSNYKDADLKYYSINFEENHNKEIAQKYNVAWSSLFITSGDSFEDLTDFAFQVINSDSKQLTDRIQNIIDDYLN